VATDNSWGSTYGRPGTLCGYAFWMLDEQAPDDRVNPSTLCHERQTTSDEEAASSLHHIS
jgi:hypothetical protein